MPKAPRPSRGGYGEQDKYTVAVVPTTPYLPNAAPRERLPVGVIFPSEFVFEIIDLGYGAFPASLEPRESIFPRGDLTRLGRSVDNWYQHGSVLVRLRYNSPPSTRCVGDVCKRYLLPLLQKAQRVMCQVYRFFSSSFLNGPCSRGSSLLLPAPGSCLQFLARSGSGISETH